MIMTMTGTGIKDLGDWRLCELALISEACALK